MARIVNLLALLHNRSDLEMSSATNLDLPTLAKHWLDFFKLDEAPRVFPKPWHAKQIQLESSLPANAFLALLDFPGGESKEANLFKANVTIVASSSRVGSKIELWHRRSMKDLQGRYLALVLKDKHPHFAIRTGQVALHWAIRVDDPHYRPDFKDLEFAPWSAIATNWRTLPAYALQQTVYHMPGLGSGYPTPDYNHVKVSSKLAQKVIGLCEGLTWPQKLAVLDYVQRTSPSRQSVDLCIEAARLSATNIGAEGLDLGALEPPTKSPRYMDWLAEADRSTVDNIRASFISGLQTWTPETLKRLANLLPTSGPASQLKIVRILSWEHKRPDKDLRSSSSVELEKVVKYWMDLYGVEK